MKRMFLSAVDAITPRGWGVVLVGALSLVLGLMNSWTELVAIGVMSLTTFFVAIAWSFRRIGHHVRLNLSTSRVTVGERAVGELVIVNPTSRFLPATAIELSVGSNVAFFATGRIATGEEYTAPFGIITSRRGIVTVGPARAVRGDPLGLITCGQAWPDSALLHIHPRIVRVSAVELGFLRDVEGDATQDFSSSGVSFHALRDYIAGDDRRSIHWRSTAHAGKLMVRQFEEIRRAHLLIMLDLNEEAWGSTDEFEEGVSAVASLAVATVRESKEVSIMTQTGLLRPPTPMSVLDSLSGVEPLSSAVQLPELARQALAEVPQASVVAVVTGSRTSFVALGAVRGRVPVDIASFGVRFDAEGDLEHRVLGGFTILSVPSMDDFSRGMRRILL